MLCRLGIFLVLLSDLDKVLCRYSASYVMVTAGTSGAFLAVLYVFTDVLQHAGFLRLSKPFMCLGVNSITGMQLALVLQRLLHLQYRCSGV